MTTTELNTSGLASHLAHIPASDVKKRGWRGVMRTLKSLGSVVVTNHSEPEAVIVTTDEYLRLLAIANAAEAKTESALETLRSRFDERLATMQRADAGDKLRAVMKAPAKLRGKVRAGAGH